MERHRSKERCLSLIYNIINMKSLRFIISSAIVSTIVLLFVSCGGVKNDQKEGMFNAGDSVYVNEITDSFMREIQNKEYEVAFSRLYNIGPDQLEVISEEEQNQLKEYFTIFPVLNYQLKSTNWVNVYNVTYNYSFEFFEKKEGSEIPNTMNLTLKPMKLSDRWFLTLEKK